MTRQLVLVLGVLGLCTITFSIGHAAVPGDAPQSGYKPKIAPASAEAEQALSSFRLPPGMTAELVAAEPLVANPVAFCFDAQGRIYVAETFRQQFGVVDNRGNMHWLHDDLAAQTVEDRLAYFRKHMGDKVNEYGVEHDRIRQLIDRDGDGRFESATVFADGFNQIEDGTGAGVLVRNGDVYYTCIPKLYRLRDTDDDGAADTREVLHDGYGVRVAFRGHDMHGLVIGFDGRIYFSIGDRGYNVLSQEGRRFVRPDTGAVFRCEPDGSNLEVFACGLRNPQELAFDDEGNLFTGDNNSDSGDRARWVYVVEGGDTGWRMYYQYLPDRGPWNRERIWYPYHSDDDTTRLQPASIIPPIAHLGDGPSGLVAYPGVGLPDRYDGHFFLADFRGGSSNSGVRSFAVKPQGASFELTDSHEFIWSILATDVDFGFDGNLYVSDWVNGWNGEGKGRIYRFTHADAAADADGIAARFREGFQTLTSDELVRSLNHADRRMRMEAQFELVARIQADKLPEQLLLGALEESQPRPTRLHAVFGLGQLLRAGKLSSAAYAKFLAYQFDKDESIRAQVARTSGDALQEPVLDGLLAVLRNDPSPRVKHLAATSLGRLFPRAKIGPAQTRTIIETLLAVLSQNQDADAVLRHGIVMGLTGIAQTSPQLLVDAAENRPSHYERMGILLALRRVDDPGVRKFLNDPEPELVVEAARAVNDVPLDALTPELAALIQNPSYHGNDALMRRVINANFRIGGTFQAGFVAQVAANPSAPPAVRLEAARALKEWNSPEPLDRVLGSWRPVTNRQSVPLATVLLPHLGGLFAGNEDLRQVAIEIAAEHGIRDVGPTLREFFRDPVRPVETRVAALQGLAALSDPDLRSIVDAALEDSETDVRARGLRILADLSPTEVVPRLTEVLTDGDVREQQEALRILANLTGAPADQELARQMTRMIAGNLPADIQLDALEAARQRTDPAVQKLVADFERQRSELANPLKRFALTLHGGDPRRGEEIFFSRSDASCRRCHAVRGSGGVVGPELTKIAATQNREYLLQAIVDPSAKIAKGFETAILVLDDGKVQTGIVKQEDDRQVTLMQSDGSTVLIEKDRIEERAPGKSGMPDDLVKKLSLFDIRDLVAYLATLSGAPTSPAEKPADE